MSDRDKDNMSWDAHHHTGRAKTLQSRQTINAGRQLTARSLATSLGTIMQPPSQKRVPHLPKVSINMYLSVYSLSESPIYSIHARSKISLDALYWTSQYIRAAHLTNDLREPHDNMVSIILKIYISSSSEVSNHTYT